MLQEPPEARRVDDVVCAFLDNNKPCVRRNAHATVAEGCTYIALEGGPLRSSNNLTRTYDLEKYDRTRRTGS